MVFCVEGKRAAQLGKYHNALLTYQMRRNAHKSVLETLYNIM
jgi:hypothetical protein